VTSNQPSAAAVTTDHRSAADVARPTPMLTPDGEPAMADWSLNDGARHLNHGSFGAVPLIARLPELLATNLDDAVDLRHHLAVTARVETGITTWRGHGFLRLSTHVYNTPEDYEDFAERVVPLIAELGRRAQFGARPSRR